MLETIKEDTDEDTWAYSFLEDAIIKIKEWFEEYDIYNSIRRWRGRSVSIAYTAVFFNLTF